MFENAVKLLVIVMRNYNSNIRLDQIENSYHCLAQYMTIKNLLVQSGHNITVETIPVDSKSSVTGKSFLFTKLKFRRVYFETYPFLAAEGFKDDGNAAVYEFHI